MQCVILAGGLGLRMRHYNARTPKALLEVYGKPFAHWQLSWLSSQGFDQVLYCIGYRGDRLRNYVGDGSRWGLSVDYSDEGSSLLGTGGALRLASDRILLDNEFLVLYGDSYLVVSISEFVNNFVGRPEPALMAVYRNQGQFDASNAVFAGGFVTRYEKGIADPLPDMCWIDYGLSALERHLIEELVPPGVNFDLAAVFGILSARRELGGFPVNDRFYEVGSPEGLRDLGAYISARRALLDDPHPKPA